MSRSTTAAYIDGANLYNGVKNSGWWLDYKKFRIWLSDKYNIQRAYLFLGFISERSDLYERLRVCGYILVFKETVRGFDGQIKGNCDADLVLNVVRDVYEGKCDGVVLVSSDGDYASLVMFLMGKNLLRSVLSPYTSKLCSILLKRTNAPISYIEEHKNTLHQK